MVMTLSQIRKPRHRRSNNLSKISELESSRTRIPAPCSSGPKSRFSSSLLRHPCEHNSINPNPRIQTSN